MSSQNTASIGRTSGGVEVIHRRPALAWPLRRRLCGHEQQAAIRQWNRPILRHDTPIHIGNQGHALDTMQARHPCRHAFHISATAEDLNIDCRFVTNLLVYVGLDTMILSWLTVA